MRTYWLLGHSSSNTDGPTHNAATQTHLHPDNSSSSTDLFTTPTSRSSIIKRRQHRQEMQQTDIFDLIQDIPMVSKSAGNLASLNAASGISPQKRKSGEDLNCIHKKNNGTTFYFEEDDDNKAARPGQTNILVDA